MKIIRITLAFVCAGLVLTFVSVPPAQAGLVDFFFPSLAKKEPDPSQTLQAPFADNGSAQQQGPSDAEVKRDPNNYIPLNLPHMADGAVSDWVVNAVSDILTFPSDDYTVDLARLRGYFDDTGYNEYGAFLEEKSLKKVLESKQFYVRSFVQDVPLLLNEGPVSEQYRWLYEVPVMVTYMDRSMKDYKKSQPVSQRVIITVQVGRVHGDTQNDSGLMVERWSGKVQIIDKK